MKVTREVYRDYLETRLRRIDSFAEKMDDMAEGLVTVSDTIALGQQKDYIMKELYKIDRESPKVQVKIGDKIVSA